MNALSNVLVFKISATVVFWCIPLLLFPSAWLEALGFPKQETWMFLRMLGWAYLALCVGYGFALAASLRGQRLIGAIWAGIVSNGGACAFLLFYGLQGTWTSWEWMAQVILWGSAVATAGITTTLYLFGVRNESMSVAPGVAATKLR